MNLTRFTDYGLRTLMYLAVQDPGRRVTIQDIVDCYDLSKDHVVKVVHRLGTLGYVETARGKNGGIRLAMDAEAMSVGEVVRSLEPALRPVECDNPPCRLNGNCGLRTVMDEAMDAFLAVLDGHTLSDVVRSRSRLRAVLGAFENPAVAI